MILARRKLSPDDFYIWNALVTLMGISHSFCFLGAEQLFLRFSAVTESRIVSINQRTLFLMAAMLTLFVALMTLFSEVYFFQLPTLTIYLLVGCSVGIFVFVYNFLRVRRSLTASQFAAQGWKATMLAGLALASRENATWTILAGLGAASILCILLFATHRRSLAITHTPMPKGWRGLFLGFMISLFTLMLLNNFDRLMMARLGSEQLFSIYVYLVTLLLMPFSLLSNYFGFKEVANLKQSYLPRIFRRRTIWAGVTGAGLMLPWFAMLYGLQETLEVEIKPEYLVPCVIVVACRCSYPFLSALFTLWGKSTEIYAANALTVLAMLTVVAVALAGDITIIRTLYLLAAFWCIRVGIFSWLISKIDPRERAK